MVMNKKGQTIFFAIMLGIVILILALSFAKPVQESSQAAGNNTYLNCTNTTISDFNKGACVVNDLTIFYFIGGLIFIAGSVIAAKIIFT